MKPDSCLCCRWRTHFACRVETHLDASVRYIVNSAAINSIPSHKF
jgi:hypothetical protein